MDWENHIKQLKKNDKVDRFALITISTIISSQYLDIGNSEDERYVVFDNLLMYKIPYDVKLLLTGLSEEEAKNYLNEDNPFF